MFAQLTLILDKFFQQIDLLCIVFTIQLNRNGKMNKENSSQLHSHNYSTFIQFHLTINSAIDNMYKVVMMLSKFE